MLSLNTIEWSFCHLNPIDMIPVLQTQAASLLHVYAAAALYSAMSGSVSQGHCGRPEVSSASAPSPLLRGVRRRLPLPSPLLPQGGPNRCNHGNPEGRSRGAGHRNLTIGCRCKRACKPSGGAAGADDWVTSISIHGSFIMQFCISNNSQGDLFLSFSCKTLWSNNSMFGTWAHTKH